MLIAQARTRYRVYPSLAASRWIHQQYVKDGGQFTDSTKKLSPADAKAKKIREKNKDDAVGG